MSKNVLISQYGGASYSESKPQGQKVGSYSMLGSAYSQNPMPSAVGYPVLGDSYKQSVLFSSPYQARQCSQRY